MAVPPESATAERQQVLKLLIARAFDDSDGTYGYRRIACQLARQGIAAGAELVRKLMRRWAWWPASRAVAPCTTRQGAPGRSRTW